MKKPKLEIACFNLESALIASQSGADRIELCDNYLVGGTTPKPEIILQSLQQINMPIYVMIRPRGGDFCYTAVEYARMKNDIIQLKTIGVDGFVFGVLDKNKELDIKPNEELVNLSYPLPCTLHRAFDEVKDSFKTLEEAIQCGFSTVLTSGKMKSAIEGIETIKGLIKQSSKRINIMPGGGIRCSNIAILLENLETSFYHSSAITDNMKIASEEEIIKIKNAIEEFYK